MYFFSTNQPNKLIFLVSSIFFISLLRYVLVLCRSSCPVAEADSNFRCGGMNMHYAKLTNLWTIIHTHYVKYMYLGVAEARARQIASSATVRNHFLRRLRKNSLENSSVVVSVTSIPSRKMEYANPSPLPPP